MDFCVGSLSPASAAISFLNFASRRPLSPPPPEFRLASAAISSPEFLRLSSRPLSLTEECGRLASAATPPNLLGLLPPLAASACVLLRCYYSIMRRALSNVSFYLFNLVTNLKTVLLRANFWEVYTCYSLTCVFTGELIKL